VTNIIGAGGGVQAVGGQANTIPKFTGSQTLGASIISDNGATVTIAGSLNLVVPQSTNTPLSIWPSNPVPANPSDPSDGNAVELGLKFRSDVSGFITGVRFYKGINNTGAHVGNLWTSSGVLVASAAFTNETATGWQDVSFPDPVPIAANTTYIVSYHTNVGHYAADIGFFASSGVDTGPLHALKEGVDGGNGVFHYGASSLFPNQTFSSYNYWLDPEFVQNVGAQQITANGTPITSATLLNNYDLAKRGASQTFTGDNTFHNASDSTASFSIQNASGTTMLQVDTTNGIVYIGTIGGDSSGIRLVLGTKTTIDDPEGVEGAIYYNAAEKMFRCYRGGGMWDPCADFEADHGFTVYDEFLGGATTSFSDAIGSLGWRAQAIGANGVLNFNSATPAPVASRPGILDLQTPAVANQGTTLLLGTGASGSLLLGQSDVVKTAVAVGAATNQVLRIGLHSETTSTTQPLSGVWWEANPAASSFWRFCYGDGTTATCADSTEPIAANVWESLEIRVLDVGTGNSHIAFTINGNVAGTVSNVTVDSTNRVSPAFSCFATSGAAQHCYWDYFQLTGTYISSNFR
ncbi:MAG TPA: DUF4082 domain-containing protein, partial [Candidatus Saccharimonadales bacterium]|nr:DUF4082 domain-containing protein [Candidatus Saccharimonadales bacterium]